MMISSIPHHITLIICHHIHIHLNNTARNDNAYKGVCWLLYGCIFRLDNILIVYFLHFAQQYFVVLRINVLLLFSLSQEISQSLSIFEKHLCLIINSSTQLTIYCSKKTIDLQANIVWPVLQYCHFFGRYRSISFNIVIS